MVYDRDRLDQDLGSPPSIRARCTGTRRSCDAIEKIVIEALAQAGRPQSAYDIAAYSRSTGQELVPAQVYRTLSRLIEQERVSRIESLSAFTLKQESADLCLIDASTHKATWISAPNLVNCLNKLAKAAGFTPSRTIIEVHGKFDTRH